MPFPISPVNDQTYITPQGTAYKYYAANKAWNIIGAGTDVIGLTPNYLPLAATSTTLSDSPIFLNGSQLDANSNVENGYVFGMENTRDDWDANGLRVGVKNLQTGTVIQEWRSDNTRRAAMDCVNGMFVDSSLGSYSLYDNAYSHGVTDILPANVHGRISSAIDLSDGESTHYGQNCGGLKLVGIDAYGTYAAIDVKAVGLNYSNYPYVNISASKTLGTSDTTINSGEKIVSFKNKDIEKVNITGDGKINAVGGSNFGSPSHYLNIDSTGHLTLSGNATVFKSISLYHDSLSDATKTAYTPGGGGITVGTWAYGQNNKGYFSFALPPDYKEGSTFYQRVHWTPGSNGNEQSGNYVTFYAHRQISNQEGTFFSNTSSFTDTCDGTDHKHQVITENISGSGLTIGAMVLCKIFRGTTTAFIDTWNDATGMPLLLGFEVIYEADSLGGNTYYSKT